MSFPCSHTSNSTRYEEKEKAISLITRKKDNEIEVLEKRVEEQEELLEKRACANVAVTEVT